MDILIPVSVTPTINMFKFIAFFAFVSIVAANDIVVGPKDKGNKIVDEQRIASPALWVQTANLTYNASDSEVISRVNVTDMRPDKDGSARIVEGGEGFKNVKIELKSPTILRGYDFLIEVYAVTDDYMPSSTTEQSNLDVTTEREAPKIPTCKTSDVESSTLKSLAITTGSTLAADDHSTEKSQDRDESKVKGVDTPVNVGKDVKEAVDVSTTPKISTPTEILPNDTTVHSEVAEGNQNKSDESQLKPVVSDSNVHEQFRNVRNSEVPAVEEKDFVVISTGLPDDEGSTESITTLGTDATTSQSSSDIVTVIYAETTKKDIIVPRVLTSYHREGDDQGLKIPIPYNH